MPSSTLHPDIENALEIGNRPTPTDPDEAFAAIDRPLHFGDDVIDGLQGVVQIAQNAKKILCAPRLPQCNTAPTIAVGGGPSLERHLDALRKLQSKCLIVASQTSVKGLMEAGITPHISTPIERLSVMANHTPEDCGPVAFAGAPLVHPSVVERFNKHYYVPSADVLYQWTNVPGEHDLFFGSSTGVAAINVAAYMCPSHPVYLVGHDLCHVNGSSHWSASQGKRVDECTEQVRGNNGEMVQTNATWRRLIGQIAETVDLHDKIINVNAHDKIGAFIPRVGTGQLPDPDTLPDFVMPEAQPCEARMRQWRSHARKMAMHARQLDRFCQHTKSISETDTNLLAAGIGRNVYAFSYNLVSLLVQLSYMGRMRMCSPDQLHQWFKSATHNVLYNCRPFFEEISELAEQAK